MGEATQLLRGATASPSLTPRESSTLAASDRDASRWGGSVGEELLALRAERDAVVRELGRPGALKTMAELTQLIDEETARVGLILSRRRYAERSDRESGPERVEA